MSRRLTVGVVLFGLAAVAVVSLPPVERAAAQAGKGDKGDKNDKQEAALRQELAQANKAIAALKQDVNQLQAVNKKLQADLKKSAKDDRKDDKSIRDLNAAIDAFRGAGLVHVVVLKLKPDSPASEAQSVIDETYSQLAKIKTVRAVWAGRPSAKATPEFATTDYTVALLFLFDDSSGLRQYHDDPVHTKFMDRHLKKWETPIVYDFEPKKR